MRGILRLKKKAQNEGSPLIFEDECSFRQDATLHATWSKCGRQPLVPTTGFRKSMKIFGCVDIIKSRFIYKTDDIFNAASYKDFLEVVGQRFFKKDRKAQYIQDNASYHKSDDVRSWFRENSKFIEVHFLPPYCPELNPVEGLWKYVRRSGTHNHYFGTKDEMKEPIRFVFRGMQKNPSKIAGYLKPFL